MIAVYLLIAAALLLLNAFFVLAEFAIIKIRPTRVEELIDQGSSRARVVRHIQHHMDEYLSVCQLGITFASIGLGFAGEPAIARLIEPLIPSKVAAHTVAVTLAYILVSFLHVVLGELVPKSLAIRRAERSSLLTARPMRFFYLLLYLPLKVLNGASNMVLRLMGISGKVRETHHSEQELRMILAHSQSMGLMSFRRLLLMENIFDLGDLKVRDAMRPKSQAKVLRVEAPWEDNFKMIRESRFSRYPLVEASTDRPLGIIHVKDLFYEGAAADMRKLARPYAVEKEDEPLEAVLADLQKRRGHMMIAVGADGRWSGFITLEDILEEIIGTIEDEFEIEPPMNVADALSAARIVLGLRCDSIEEAIREAVARVPAAELPLPPDKVVAALLERERAVPTYLGRGLAIPHARLDGLTRPTMILARSEEGVPVKGVEEKAHLLFILLTPLSAPRTQARLLARVGGLMDSEYVEEILHTGATPQAVFDAIKAGEPFAVS